MTIPKKGSRKIIVDSKPFTIQENVPDAGRVLEDIIFPLSFRIRLKLKPEKKGKLWKRKFALS